MESFKLIKVSKLLLAIFVLSLPAYSGSNYDNWCDMGQALAAEGNLKQAARAYQSALEVQNQGHKALLGLRKIYERMLKKSPRDKKIQESYIELVSSMKDTLELQKALDYVLRRDSKSHYLQFRKGEIYLSNRDTAKAYESFRTAYIGQRTNEKYAEKLLLTIKTDDQIKRAMGFLKKMADQKDAPLSTQFLYLRGTVKKKRWNVADGIFQKIFEKDKKQLHGNPVAIRVFFQKKKYGQAAELAEIYLKNNHKDTEIREMLVNCYLKLKKDDKLIRQEVFNLVQELPESLNWKLELARLDATLGDTASAVKYAKSLIEKNPKSKTGYELLEPMLANNSEERETYIKVLEKLIAFSPATAKNRRRTLGLIRYDQGNFKEAEKQISRCIKFFSKEHELWYKLGISRLKLNKKAISENNFKQAYLLQPENVYYAREYGIFQVSNKAIKAHLKLFSFLENHKPGITEQIKIAKSYSLNNQHADAARVWKRIAKLDPLFVEKSSLAVKSLAEVKKATEVEPAKRIEPPGKLEDPEPNIKKFRVNLDLAKKMKKGGNLKEALKYFHKAHEFNPKDVPVIVAMADLYETQKEYSKGIDFYIKALKLKPRSKVIQKNAVALGTKSNVPALLKSIYLAILEKNPGSHHNQFELGLIYFDEGKIDSAVVKWKKALKLDPKNDTYKNALKHATTARK